MGLKLVQPLKVVFPSGTMGCTQSKNKTSAPVKSQVAALNLENPNLLGSRVHEKASREKPISSTAIAKEDVTAVQNAWADAIKRISQVYKEKGDYVMTAADAAGELYA